MKTVSLLALLLLVVVVWVAEGQRGTPGSSPATGCSVSSGRCAGDGSSNYADLSGLAFTKSDGKFRGTMVMNQCPAFPFGDCPGCAVTTENRGGGQADCQQQTFPAPGYDGSAGTGAPLRGRVGLTLHGVNIYGPMEAGFGFGNFPQPCSGSATGRCLGGLDVATCEELVVAQCGSANTNFRLFLDSCGGHAMPYHYHGTAEHAAAGCDYDASQPGHSPLIGVALDGYGIYGLNEGTGELPQLDACGGHVGYVPEDKARGVPAGTYYHYHVSKSPPYTLGCYGKPDGSMTAEQCKGLYPQCNTGYTVVMNATFDERCYDLDCPCYDRTVYNNTALSVSQCRNDPTFQSTFSGPLPTKPPTPSPTDSTPVPSRRRRRLRFSPSAASQITVGVVGVAVLLACLL